MDGMKNRLRYYWVSFKMFWLTFSLPARVAMIAVPVIAVLTLFFAPGHDYWVLLCGVTLALLPLTLLAIFLLFREIK